ncbi:MAG: amino acid permease [Planctomycetota bacterium]|mgnify:CR=1 FL=1|nr:MAG: amino acid permease [Planctomycetota bacterium]
MATTTSNNEPGAATRRAQALSTWDTVSVIVGIVIGAGIYETPPLIFGNVATPGLAMVAWIAGGLLCLNGAFTYAELASAYPRSGGDYVYLTRAYGSWVGFLFGWAQISVILTGSIGMMAYVFADYASTLWNFGPATTLVYACASVIVLTLSHAAGLALGKRVQNVLSSAKLLGLAAVVLAAFAFAAPAEGAAPVEQLSTADALSTLVGASFAFALVQVFLTYGGWNDAAFFVAEMADRRKIVRALTLGILVIMATYLLVNLAYLRVLGFQGSRDSQAIAADTMEQAVGPTGARAVALLVAVSALGAVNGLIFAGSRVYAAVGKDHRAFALLARQDAQFRTPLWSLGAQAAVTLAMLLAVGTPFGQAALNAVFSRIGLGEVAWEGKGGFELLLQCTAPVFWLFFLLTSVSLFVLRYREPGVPRPFRAPLYPLAPLFFVATCGYMFYGGLQYAGNLSLVGFGLLLVGLPVYWLSRYAGPTHTRETND